MITFFTKDSCELSEGEGQSPPPPPPPKKKKKKRTSIQSTHLDTKMYKLPEGDTNHCVLIIFGSEKSQNLKMNTLVVLIGFEGRSFSLLNF